MPDFSLPLPSEVQQQPQNRFLKPLMIGCGSVIAVVVFAIFGVILFLGVGITTGWLAETKVVRGDELPERQVKTISEIIGLRPGEKIQYYYGSEIFVSDDGNLLTNQRVISYYVEEDGSMVLDQAEFAEIESTEFYPAENAWLEDSQIDVYLKDESVFTLLVSSEEGGDEKFNKALTDAIAKHAKKSFE